MIPPHDAVEQEALMIVVRNVFQLKFGKAREAVVSRRKE